MKNSNLFKLSLLAFSVLGIAGCSHAEPTKIEEEFFVFKEEDVISQGMKISRLSSGVDQNSNPYITVRYSTVPNNAAYGDIDVSSSFVGGGSCDSYVTVNHDATNKLVVLTCLQPFSTLIDIHLEAHYKSSVYADITVHYAPKYSQGITDELEYYKPDPENPSSTVGIGWNDEEVYERAFSFSTSINTENVSSNPREGVTVTEEVISRYNFSTTYSYGEPGNNLDGWYKKIYNLTAVSNYVSNPNIVWSNNISVNWNNIGFIDILPNLLSVPFYRGTQNHFPSLSADVRLAIINYLNSDQIDNDLSFGDSYTKLDFVADLNQWISDNSIIYIPIWAFDFGYLNNGTFCTDIPVTYGNSETDTFDGSAGNFSMAKIKSFTPISQSELAPSNLTAESISVSF